MGTITIRGANEELSRALKQESLVRDESVNKLVLNALCERFLHPASTRIFTDLDHLAGTWTEEDYAAFRAATADLDCIQSGDWT
ncbi:MAG TPA: hypothetical protein PLC54_04640 [Spirochaetales bacterium]|nr:hypothetical protein [Spirochaetales bacterium]